MYLSGTVDADVRVVRARATAMASVKSMIAAGLLAAPCAKAFVAPGASHAVTSLRSSTAVKAESSFGTYSALAVSATSGAAVMSFVGAKEEADPPQDRGLQVQPRSTDWRHRAFGIILSRRLLQGRGFLQELASQGAQARENLCP